MDEDGNPIDTSGDGGGTTTDFSGSGDTPPPPDSSVPTDANAGQQPMPGISPMSAFPNTDANLPTALGAVDSIAGMSFPTNAQLGQSGATPSDAEVAASSGDPQAGITEAAKTAQNQTSGGASSTPSNAPQPTSMVSKIGGGLLDLAKSAGFGTILGSVLQGISAGKASEAAIAEKRRLSAAFTPQDFSTMLQGTNTPIPMGYLERARRVGQFLNGGAQPTIGAPTTPMPATH